MPIAEPGHYVVATVYYRLRQVDTDGRATYSPVRTLAVGLAAHGQLTVLSSFPSPAPANSQLTVTGATGHRLRC